MTLIVISYRILQKNSYRTCFMFMVHLSLCWQKWRKWLSLDLCEKYRCLKSYLALSRSLSGSVRLTSIHGGVVILTRVVVSAHICLKSGKNSTQGKHYKSDKSSSGHIQFLFDVHIFPHHQEHDERIGWKGDMITLDTFGELQNKYYNNHDMFEMCSIYLATSKVKKKTKQIKLMGDIKTCW